MKHSFSKFYSNLNTEQKKAVDTIEGPVMVIAGPGTGKTQVLTARIANILKLTDAEPSSILAVTFTESAAANMRQRLAEMIGRTAYYVQIQTFHAFCADVISQNPEYFPLKRDSIPLSELEKHQIFEEIIDSLDLEILKPLNQKYYYLKVLIKSISDLKREGVSSLEFEQIVVSEKKKYEIKFDELKKTARQRQERNLKKQSELILIFQEYQKELASRGRFDFDDMISLTAEAFENNPILLQDYQENLHYFLVDEYQDTNSAQNKVIYLLASYWGEQANIFTVGDPNQSIYRFQGASTENTLDFLNHFPKAKIINLQVGYRCPQDIYGQAAKLINYNQLSKDMVGSLADVQKLLTNVLKSSKRKAESKKSISLHQAPVQTLEAIYVAEKIKELVKSGTPPEEIAILYRNHSDAVDIVDALSKWQIQWKIEGRKNLFGEELIDQWINYCRLILKWRSHEENNVVFNVLNYEWLGLDGLMLMKLSRLAFLEKKTFFHLMHKSHKEINEINSTIQFNENNWKKLELVVSTLEDLSKLDANVNFLEWFEQAISKSGYLTHIRQLENKIDALTNINSLFLQTKSFVSSNHNFKLTDFIFSIETMQEHGIQLLNEDLELNKQAVQLATVHKAKGREWDYVFLIKTIDKKWGNSRKRDLLPLPSSILKNTNLDLKERNEDDRRLFYVALTRARKQFLLSYPETIITDTQSRDVSQSIFLQEIDDFEQDKSPELSKHPEKYLSTLLTPQPRKKMASDEKAFFSSIVRNLKISTTTLDKYLRDPKEFVEDVLLRVPRAKHPVMSFGSSVHAALEYRNRFYQKNNVWPELNSVLEVFRNSLSLEILTTTEFNKRLKYGELVLNKYLDHYKSDIIKIFETEMIIGSGRHRAVLSEDIELTGRIDLIQVVDKQGKTVRVVDYKTGRTKTNGQIEAKVKSAFLSDREKSLPEPIRGRLKRQLLFYKLLIELDPVVKYEVTEGMFDFVEPDKTSNKFIRRNFLLKNDDVKLLKDLIVQVMTEIRNLDFLEMV